MQWKKQMHFCIFFLYPQGCLFRDKPCKQNHIDQPPATHPSRSGWILGCDAPVKNRQSWRSDMEHELPALTPLNCDLKHYLPVLREPAWPPEPIAPLRWEHPPRHRTTNYFYPSLNNSWESHKMCLIVFRREQKAENSQCLPRSTSIITYGSLN